MKLTGTDLDKKAVTRTLGLCAALLFATAGPLATASFADEAQPSQMDAAFQSLDQNKDGQLTAVEVKGNAELSRQWTAIDKDDNGSIDEAEFSAFEAMQKGHGE